MTYQRLADVPLPDDPVIRPTVKCLLHDHYGQFRMFGSGPRRGGRRKANLPGGGVELGETWQTSLRAELWEEIGLHVPLEWCAQAQVLADGLTPTSRPRFWRKYVVVCELELPSVELSPVNGELAAPCTLRSVHAALTWLESMTDTEPHMQHLYACALRCFC